MKSTCFNKAIVYISSFLLSIFSATAAYLQQPFLGFIPAGIIMTLLLVHYPEWLLYLLLAAIPWSFEYNFSPSLATDLPDEPLMLVTAFAALALLICKRKREDFKYWHPLIFIVLLQLIWMLIAVILSSDVLVSAKYLLAKTWYLLAFIVMPLFLFKNTRVLSYSAAVLTASMLLLMLVSLVRHAGYGWTFEKVNTALAPFFRNHVNYSALLVCMVPLQIAFIRLTASRQLRFCLICLLLLTIVAAYLSYARGAWLALATGMITYWLLRKRLLVTGLFLFIAICVGAVFWLKSNDRYLQLAPDYKSTIFHTNFSEHLLATYRMKDLSTAERYYRWIAGVRMSGDSWMTGFGPNTFYDNYKSYTIPAFKTWVSKNEEHSTVHNYFLLLLVEQGMIGLLLFLTLIGCLFVYAQNIYHRTKDQFWRMVTATATSILTMICTVNFLSDLIETDKVGSVFYLSIAVLITADLKQKSKTTT